MEAVSDLHHMQFVLKEWQEDIDSQQNNNNRFGLTTTLPLKLFKSPTKPALYEFYSKFYGVLVSKVKSSTTFIV